MSMSTDEFRALRRFVDTSFGRIAYADKGEGKAVVFIHGVPLNGYHWRGQISELSDERRCIAIDLMGLGYTEVPEEQDLSFPNQARMILEALELLGADDFDLVGNDSGGAIAQLVAVYAPERIRSLILTNCDVHDNWPPPAFVQTHQLAKAGRLGAACDELMSNLGLAQSDFGLGVGFEHPENITLDLTREYLAPIAGNKKRQRQLDKFVASMDCEQTLAIHRDLQRLEVPTMIIWGMNDVFFPLRWSVWLRDTIPGAKQIVEIPGAKLFFCEERPKEVSDHIRSFWNTLLP